jgi:hypothetical protein
MIVVDEDSNRLLLRAHCRGCLGRPAIDWLACMRDFSRFLVAIIAELGLS